MSKGYVIVAQNNSDVDYIRCARVLAKSIRVHDITTPICLLTDVAPDSDTSVFNSVLTFPHGDRATREWKLDNDWQVYNSTPYDETFKIEADVIVTRNLNSWWEYCSSTELHIATGALTYRGVPATSRFYRGALDRQHLPDVYNGLTYFKRSTLAGEFYSIVRSLFESTPGIDTDTVYATAASMVGVEHCTRPHSPVRWVHMKPKINNTLLDDWTQELSWELTESEFRIATFSQLYPVHYVVKDFAKQLETHYERIFTR
jgi:hypothetical protein